MNKRTWAKALRTLIATYKQSTGHDTLRKLTANRMISLNSLFIYFITHHLNHLNICLLTIVQGKVATLHPGSPTKDEDKETTCLALIRSETLICIHYYYYYTVLIVHYFVLLTVINCIYETELNFSFCSGERPDVVSDQRALIWFQAIINKYVILMKPSISFTFTYLENQSK